MKIFKKELTAEQEVEKMMMDKYKLKKDPSIPHRYWLGSQSIDILMSDDQSVKEAETEIQRYYRKPQLTQNETTPVKKGFFASGGANGFMKEFENIGNNFTHNAPTMTNDLSSLGGNAMQHGVKNAQSLSGMEGLNPDMSSMFDGTVAAPKKKPPVRKPRAKK